MNYKLGLLVLAGLAAAPWMATTATAQSTDCQSAQFNKDLVARFPDVRNGCLEIITRDGQQYAVYKANLVRASNSGVTVRFKLPNGKRGKSRFIKLSREFRALVEGKPVRAGDLAVGQELTAYVKVSEPEVAIEPADDKAPLELTEISETPPPAAASGEHPAHMPKTASNVPLLAVFGIGLLLAGGLLRRVRTAER